MNRFSKTFAFSFLALLLAGGSAFAVAIPTPTATLTIQDNYIGGGYQQTDDHGATSSQYLQNDNDVVSESHEIDAYDVDAMYVDFYDDFMSIDIQTDYEGGTDSFGTVDGDLFISSTGWNPYGEEPYNEDTVYNGTVWDYVFDVSEGILYYIGDAQENIVTSDEYGNEYIGWWQDGWYRHDQEVLIDSTGLTAVGSGSFDRKTEDGISYLSMNIIVSGVDFDPENIGFHWTMTCGNDVIEGGTYTPAGGAAATPEPATMILLACGLFGLAGLRRKFSK